MSRELDFDSLSNEDKEWLRAWNRADEIPGEDVDTTASEDFTRVNADPDDDGEQDYSDMTKEELQEEAESRGLAKSGTKDEIIARLEEDDAGNG